MVATELSLLAANGTTEHFTQPILLTENGKKRLKNTNWVYFAKESNLKVKIMVPFGFYDILLFCMVRSFGWLLFCLTVFYVTKWL